MERNPQTAQLSQQAVLPVIVAALKEDVGSRDLTSLAIIPKGQLAKAEIVARQEGVVAGLQVAEWTFGLVEPKIRFQPTVQDGQKVFPDKAVAFLEGPSRGVLAGERVSLNFLGRLSGIATLTRTFVEKVKGTQARILDTRKTTPTLRLLEKYAVAVGGGVNHRMGLYDGVLIKDNHLKLIGGIEKAVKEARANLQKQTPIEVEVTSLQEFRQALSARAELILLDNMPLTEIQEVVRLRNALLRSIKGSGRPGTYRPLLEASGGVTLDNVRAIALTGVDRISIGALTHSAPALNLSLEVV